MVFVLIFLSNPRKKSHLPDPAFFNQQPGGTLSFSYLRLQLRPFNYYWGTPSLSSYVIILLYLLKLFYYYMTYIMTSAGKSREIRISVTNTVYHTSHIGELMPQIQTNKWTNNTRNSPLSLGPNNEKTSKECILFLHFVMIDDETHDILVDLKGMVHTSICTLLFCIHSHGQEFRLILVPRSIICVEWFRWLFSIFSSPLSASDRLECETWQ